MKNSYSAFVIKEGEDSDAIHSILYNIFSQKDGKTIGKILANYKDSFKKPLLNMIDMTEIILNLVVESPFPGQDGWAGSFWDLNYSDRKSDYYYENFIAKFGGKFRIVILRSKFAQESFSDLINLLKGRTTFVVGLEDKDSNFKIASAGYGIRGLFSSDAVVVSDTLIDLLLKKIDIGNHELQQYLYSIRDKNLLFPVIKEEYRTKLYNLLPQKLKDDLNTYRIHSIDSPAVLIKSFQWISEKGKIAPNDAISLNKIIMEIQ